MDDHKDNTEKRGERGRRGIEGSGIQGVQGVQGNQGVQGFQGSGERGAQGDPGERGATGKAGDRTKLPRRVFTAFILLALCNAAAFAVALEDRTRNITRIDEGRTVSVQTTCAAISAVIDAGRATIQQSGMSLPTRYERELRKLGAPSASERRVSLELAAATYARMIATRVQRSTGRTDLVRRDGTLDCRKLQRVAKVVQP